MFLEKTFDWKKSMLIALSIYLFILAFLFFFQRHLQYLPSGKLGEVVDYHLYGFEEETITTEDGVKLMSWYKEPQKDEKIILYFHGNGGNMGDRSYKFEAFSQSGFGVLAISYRGYPGSEGKPSEAGFIKDGEAALKFLFAKGYAPKDIMVFGESLGSGVAVQLAARFDFAALILESPFSSAASVAQTTYWFIPAKFMLLDKFDSMKFAGKISSPVLIFHGTSDRIVPVSESKKLFEAIKSQKRLVIVDNVGHLDFGDEFILSEMRKFLLDLRLKKANLFLGGM